MESLLIHLLSLGSLFSLASALKCYKTTVCELNPFGPDTGDCSLNSSRLHTFQPDEAYYCVKVTKTISHAAMNSTMIFRTGVSVKDVRDVSSVKDGRCYSQGSIPGIPSCQLEFCTDRYCYCQSDGCNRGCSLVMMSPSMYSLIPLLTAGLISPFRL